MEEQMVNVIIETFNIEEQLAQELFNKCGYDLKKARRYLFRKKKKENLAPIKCACCGRKLTDPKSIRRGYGEECYNRTRERYKEDLFD